MIIRLVCSALLAAVVSILLFRFMLGLLANEQVQTQIDQAITQLSFVDVPETPPKPPPPTESETPERSDALSANDLLPSMAVPEASAASKQGDIALPAADWGDFNVGVQVPTTSWTPVSDQSAFNSGEKGKGFVEIVPLATRKPNIPLLAWNHKMDGWVLVAFTLKADGRTKNIRVLDAHPGGVFEENVIRAVQDWLYDMGSIKIKGDIILTQKIELKWRDYPDNSPFLD